MSRFFSFAMCRMPQIMTTVAVFYYVASVITMLADKMTIGALYDDLASVSMKARVVLLLFFQPMIPALLLAAGAAALWRFDLWWATLTEAAE